MVGRATLLLLATLAVAACGGGESASVPAGLQDVVWEWQGSVYNNDSEATPDDPSRYTTQFADDGTISIRADCNQVNGRYEESGGSLTITLGPSTKVACPEGSLSDAFLRDLEGAAIYFFDEGDLLVDIKYDTGTMRFSPVG